METSPGQYQAWVKLSAQALPADVRGLAQHFGGDVNSAGRGAGSFGGFGPFGRLAGFTNQAPAHAQGDRHPYVLAHERSGAVAEAGPGYVERVDQALDKVAAKVESERRMQVLLDAKPGIVGGYDDPIARYQRKAHKVLAMFGATVDVVRMDWMIAVEMANTGRFDARDIERGIAQCSPHVESCKAGHVEGYARRTAQKAWAAPEVVQQRQELLQELQAKRDRGQEPGGPIR